MPKKKNGPNKSDFVRSQPSALTAAEVVAKAKEAGMIITAALVYTVRSSVKGKAPKAKKAAPLVHTPAAHSAPAALAPVVHTPATHPAPAAHTRPAGDKLSASDFIRSQPANLGATAVTQKGHAEGYTFKSGLVYKVRRAAAKKNKPAHAEAKPAAAAHAPAHSEIQVHHAPVHPAPVHPAPVHHAHGHAHANHASHKAELRKLMLHIGLDISEAIYAEVSGDLKAIAARE